MSLNINVSDKISEKEMKEIEEMVSLYNMDGGDSIPIDKLGPMLRAMGQCPTQAELKILVDEIDADGNGFALTYEFVDLLARLRSEVKRDDHDPKVELSKAIRGVFDHEKDGYMSAAEFRHLMTSSGEPLTDEEIDVIMKKFPPNGDGQVRCNDFAECIFQFWNDSRVPVTAKTRKPKTGK